MKTLVLAATALSFATAAFAGPFGGYEADDWKAMGNEPKVEYGVDGSDKGPFGKSTGDNSDFFLSAEDTAPSASIGDNAFDGLSPNEQIKLARGCAAMLESGADSATVTFRDRDGNVVSATVSQSDIDALNENRIGDSLSCSEIVDALPVE